MKTLQIFGGGKYHTPTMRQIDCRIEAGFAVSEPSSFDDMVFYDRESE